MAVAVSAAKLEVLKTNEANTAMTFCLNVEDHTLGNALRHVVIRNPDVDYCGYSLPHPSEDKIHMRIQTTQGTATEAMRKGLDDLHDVCKHILGLIDEQFGTTAFVPAIAFPAGQPEDAMEVDGGAAAAASAAPVAASQTDKKAPKKGKAAAEAAAVPKKAVKAAKGKGKGKAPMVEEDDDHEGAQEDVDEFVNEGKGGDDDDDAMDE